MTLTCGQWRTPAPCGNTRPATGLHWPGPTECSSRPSRTCRPPPDRRRSCVTSGEEDAENPDNHFKFDPVASDDEEAAAAPEAVNEQVQRSGNIDWCTCGRCRPMNCELESVCCAEISRVAALAPEGSKCIPSHPGFELICLNIHALQVAYYMLRQDRTALLDAPDIHTRYRYTAYRQFVRWVWVCLGQKNREVLPSCVVKEIRNGFSSAQYAGFKYPE
ncbi:uncharacterized protein LOC144138505 isoform X3 [Haemaphysalis longicornis]